MSGADVRGRTQAHFCELLLLLASLCQGDKDADNAVIADLARPIPATHQALG